MIRLEMKNCNMILTEKHQKYQLYHLEKLINMNILQVNICCLLIKGRQQNKLRLNIFLSEELLKKKTKTTEEQIDAITNQNKGLAALTNKDDHKDDHSDIKKYFIKQLKKNLMQ